jgi:hypothetical protein
MKYGNFLQEFKLLELFRINVKYAHNYVKVSVYVVNLHECNILFIAYIK